MHAVLDIFILRKYLWLKSKDQNHKLNIFKPGANKSVYKEAYRLVDLSKYRNGEIFTITGFYEDEGYKINVIYLGEETIKTDKGKVACYKLQPIVPKNHVFNGPDAVNVWLSANKSKTIIRIRVKMFVGNVQLDLQR